jgi:Type VI secretion system effector, Hcp
MPIYMKYEGVSGEVTEKSHIGWVELRSFEFGVGASRIIKGPTSSVERGKPVSEATMLGDQRVYISRRVSNEKGAHLFGDWRP